MKQQLMKINRKQIDEKKIAENWWTILQNWWKLIKNKLMKTTIDENW